MKTRLQDPNLSEEEPTDSEKPLVRAGWFRGPKGPVVFVYRSLDCLGGVGSVSQAVGRPVVGFLDSHGSLE